MDKHNQHSALDDYFMSMLSEPIMAEVKSPARTITLAEYPQALSKFKIPEPDSFGSLADLDKLLGSVIDIDLADVDLSVLDNETSVDLPAEHFIKGLSADIPTIELVSTIICNDGAGTATPDIIVAEESVVAIEASAHIDISDVQPVWKNVELEECFQALFFEVAGVMFAVPLTELGGIHQSETVNSLFGKPDWYLGIMQHRDKRLSVVDTAQWVMPEQNMGEIYYKYQIQLSESNWVLGCESLHGTEILNRNDIKWRSKPGSRPWLAGMVKSRMCVLLHVTEMIKLLDNGINIHGQ